MLWSSRRFYSAHEADIILGELHQQTPILLVEDFPISLVVLQVVPAHSYRIWRSASRSSKDLMATAADRVVPPCLRTRCPDMGILAAADLQH